jgi:hypothetical protein
LYTPYRARPRQRALIRQSGALASPSHKGPFLRNTSPGHNCSHLHHSRRLFAGAARSGFDPFARIWPCMRLFRVHCC